MNNYYQKRTSVDFNKAQDYLELCNSADEAFKTEPSVIQTEICKNNYEVLESYHASSNCKAILYRNGDEYIVSFFGTDFRNLKDIGTNVTMVAGKSPKQFKDAENFVGEMINKYNIPQNKLTAIGNSEGGSEAIHIKGVFGIKEAYTFNGYIPKLSQYPDYNLESNIYNFRTEGDIVSKAGHVVGEDFVVPVNLKDGKNPKWGPFGTAEWHRIENMGDCRNSQPASVYEQNNPEWKNKYIKGELKSYEVEDIPKELYALFDDAMNDRLRNCAVVNAPRPVSYNTHSGRTGCAGTYQVSGYTRNDGVQVSSYYRTCGFPHNNA